MYRYTETDNTTLVNAAHITVQVVDENNQPVSSYTITGENSDSYAKTNDYSKYYQTGQKVTVQPKAIEGRVTPDAQEVVLVNGENPVTLIYKTLPGVPNTDSMSLQPAMIVPIVVLVIGAAAITIRKFL